MATAELAALYKVRTRCRLLFRPYHCDGSFENVEYKNEGRSGLRTTKQAPFNAILNLLLYFSSMYGPYLVIDIKYTLSRPDLMKNLFESWTSYGGGTSVFKQPFVVRATPGPDSAVGCG